MIKKIDMKELSKIDLSVRFLNVEMPNPFMLSSAPPTATGEMIMRAFEMGWGGAVTKTITMDETCIFDLANRFGALIHEGRIIAFENIEELSKRTLKEWEKDVKEVKQNFPDRAFGASIMAEPDTEKWAKLGRWAEEAGFDFVELNFGCPHGLPERGMGAYVGQRADLTEEYTKAVREAISIPLMVKMTPNVTDITYIAKAAEKAGANAISAINTVLGLIGVNIDTMEPIPSVKGHSTFGGISGVAVKPIGLRAVAQIAQTVKIPVSGIGGISNWKDAVEYMLIGASTVQICTAVMLKGYRIIGDLVEGLTNYLYDKGLSKVTDIIGRSLPKIISWHDLSRFGENWIAPGPIRASINQEICIRCGLCVIACRDGGYQAINWDSEERKAEINEEKCNACSLCMHVCPVGCISWTERVKPWKPEIKGKL